ncbi:MAG: response regulator [Chloroflexota bacterium]
MPKCVIVLEDDADLMALVREFLEESEYRVVVVSSADDLLVEAARHTPCVALVDSTDPVKFNLWPLGKRLQQLDVPAIAFTAHASARAEFDADSHGFVDIVSKPFDVDEFLEAVNRVCWQPHHMAAS